MEQLHLLNGDLVQHIRLFKIVLGSYIVMAKLFLMSKILNLNLILLAGNRIHFHSFHHF